MTVLPKLCFLLIIAFTKIRTYNPYLYKITDNIVLRVLNRCKRERKKKGGELSRSDFYGSSGFIKLECCVLLFINELVPYALAVLVNSR